MVFDKVKDRISDGGGEGGGSEVTMPADPSVAKRVAESVEIDREVVEETVKRFQGVVSKMYPMVDEKTVRGDGGSSVKDDESPSFLYSVYEDEDVLVVGGAKNIMLSLSDRLELSNTETRAVVTAHKIAADDNGLGEHMVMDDVFIVPKEKRFADRGNGNGQEERLKEKMRAVKRVEENGFVLETPDRFAETLNLDSKKRFGVSIDHDNRRIRLALDPGADMDVGWHSVVRPDGDVLIPHEVAVALDIEERDVDWGVENGELVGVIESDGFDERELSETVKTTLAEDNIREVLQAHLSTNHTNALGLDEGDQAGVYLEPAGDDLAVVLAGDVFEAPTSRTVEIRNIGKGTDLLCFEVPDEHAAVLGVDDGLQRQIEWGLRGSEIVGRVVRRDRQRG